MESKTKKTDGVEVDERWLGEWITFGLAELVIYLSKHAAFDVYYNSRPQTEI